MFRELIMRNKKNQTQNGTKYLLMPTGPYTVGYKDFHWINRENISDPFYNGKNNADFSDENQINFFREIIGRVYYPSLDSIHPDRLYYSPLVTGSLYYSPLVKKWCDDIRESQAPVTEEQMQSLYEINTWATKGLSLANDQEKFPVIIFNPGMGPGANAQHYMNLISDITSQGYIVIAINNTFINDALEFPNGHIVKCNSDAVPHQDIEKIVLSDVTYTRKKMIELHEQKQNIFSSMDLNKVGLMGHSLGGVVTIMATHQYPDFFQAAVALDAPYDAIMDNALEKGFLIPLMHMHAASWREVYWKDAFQKARRFNLKNNEYFILLTPDEKDENYSRHNNFCDKSTLQYHPVPQVFSKHLAKLGMVNALDVGTMNGHQVVELTNKYLVQFFDYYFKNIPSKIFLDGIPLLNTLMTCGLHQNYTATYPNLLTQFGCSQKKISVSNVANALWLIEGSKKHGPQVSSQVNNQFSLWASQQKINVNKEEIEQYANETYSDLFQLKL